MLPMQVLSSVRERDPHATTESLHVAIKIPHAATKTRHSQINIFLKKKEIKLSEGKDLGILFAAVTPVAGTE